MKKNILIIICTYNRQEFLYKNLEILKRHFRNEIKKILIIDNASNLIVKMDSFIRVIKNKNLYMIIHLIKKD